MTTLSTGVQFWVAEEYGPTINFTTNSHTANCELVVSGSDIAPGDLVEVKSNKWGRLDNRVFRAATGSDVDTVVLEGANTVDTVRFPGTNTGTVRKIIEMVQITKPKTVNTSGGDQQFTDITALDDDEAKQAPTTRSARTTTIEVFDDPTQAYYAVLVAADESKTPRAMELRFTDGSRTVANCYLSISRIPNIQANAALTSTITASYAAEPVRYAA